jgi:hypothetical protein
MLQTHTVLHTLCSDFDVWSPKEPKEVVVPTASESSSTWKSRFLADLEASKLLSIPARRASAESLSSPLEDGGEVRYYNTERPHHAEIQFNPNPVKKNRY